MRSHQTSGVAGVTGRIGIQWWAATLSRKLIRDAHEAENCQVAQRWVDEQLMASGPHLEGASPHTSW
jgi:hypothetical protein